MPVTGKELVSVNLWGFLPAILDVLRSGFEAFAAGPGVAGGEEFLLPNVVGERIEAGELHVDVLPTEDRCVGLTHPDDLPLLRSALA